MENQGLKCGKWTTEVFSTHSYKPLGIWDHPQNWWNEQACPLIYYPSILVHQNTKRVFDGWFTCIWYCNSKRFKYRTYRTFTSYDIIWFIYIHILYAHHSCIACFVYCWEPTSLTNIHTYTHIHHIHKYIYIDWPILSTTLFFSLGPLLFLFVTTGYGWRGVAYQGCQALGLK